MLKKLLVITAVILGVGASAPAFASTIGQTTDHSTNDLTSGTGQHIYIFTPDANQTFSQITVWNDGTYGGTQTLQLISSAGSVLATGTTTGATAGATTFTFSNTNLVSGTKYALRPMTMYLMGAPYNGASDLETKGCKEYAYTIGNAIGTCGAGNTQPKADIYLSINNAITGPTLTWTYPTASASLAGDFTDWRYQMTTGSGFTGKAGIRYGTTTAMTDWVDIHTQNEYAGAYPNTSWGVYQKKSNLLTSGTYYAQVFIQNASSTDIATSTTISFTIGGGSITYNGVNSVDMPTSTSTDLIITCDPNSGFFTNSLCNMGVYLFKPSSGVFDVWSGLWTVISAKPPLGYFTKTKEAIEGINTATTSAFTFEDVSALDDNIFTPLRTGVALLLWFMFGIWLFNRFRHFHF